MIPRPLPTIKKSNYRVKMGIHEIFRVTKWRGNQVFDTRSLGMISCSDDYVAMLRQDRNIIVACASTWVMRAYLSE